MASWYCEVCDLSLKASSKYQHKKTKKHQQKSVQPDCTICTGRLTQSHSCNKCNQVWCGDCDQNISKCPYCRANISGKELQAIQQEISNINWYYQDERPQFPVFPLLDLFPPSDLYESLDDISSYPLNLHHPLSFDYFNLSA